MIGISFAASFNWIYLFIYTVAVWLVLFILRKAYKNKGEIKRQLVIGISGMLLGPTGDLVGTYFNLWHFPDGDVPIIIVSAYFFIALAAYNVFKIIEKYV